VCTKQYGLPLGNVPGNMAGQLVMYQAVWPATWHSGADGHLAMFVASSMVGHLAMYPAMWPASWQHFTALPQSRLYLPIMRFTVEDVMAVLTGRMFVIRNVSRVCLVIHLSLFRMTAPSWTLLHSIWTNRHWKWRQPYQTELIVRCYWIAWKRNGI
jgi:hypothetical protein